MSEGVRSDCSRSRRIRAEENGGVLEGRWFGLGSGERNLGRDNLLGSFCFRLNEMLE